VTALILLFVSHESNRPWNAEFVPRVLRHWLRPSALILSWYGHFFEEELNRRSHGDGDQCTNEAPKCVANECRQNRQSRTHLHGAFHHSRVEYIVFEIPVNDVKDQSRDANGNAFGERNERHDHASDR
jgi:hypothetical protein